ncbi:hypothetical protein J3459_015357 [Metarhizium acridum]|nr:hypothetical protein J3459_015357 [Metarhizium acridum]
MVAVQTATGPNRASLTSLRSNREAQCTCFATKRNTRNHPTPISPNSYTWLVGSRRGKQITPAARFSPIPHLPGPVPARGTTTRPVVDGRVLASVAAGSTAVWSGDRPVWVSELLAAPATGMKLEAFGVLVLFFFSGQVVGPSANGGF